MRREGNHAGGVHHGHAVQTAQRSLGDLDGGARVVRDDHVFAGQAVKQHRLADVGIAHQSDVGSGGGERDGFRGTMGH